MTLSCPLAILLAVLAAVAWTQSNEVSPGKTGMDRKSITEVLQEHTARLLAIPGVVGTAQGLCRGQPCIKVYVIKKTPELTERIPRVIEGFPVDIEETGEFRALSEKER